MPAAAKAMPAAAKAAETAASKTAMPTGESGNQGRVQPQRKRDKCDDEWLETLEHTPLPRLAVMLKIPAVFVRAMSLFLGVICEFLAFLPKLLRASLLVGSGEKAGLTQEALAAWFGQSTAFVSSYEDGARLLDPSEYIALARAIGVDPPNC